MRVQCLTCGGIYDTVLPDGLPYFHTCPPLSEGELARAVAAGKVTLPPGETAADAVARRVYRRALFRDENPVSSPDPKAPRRIVADGRGVQPAPAPKAPPPIVDVPD